MIPVQEINVPRAVKLYDKADFLAEIHDHKPQINDSFLYSNPFHIKIDNFNSTAVICNGA